MIGRGRYDGALTKARELSSATSAMYIVFRGDNGPGAAIQCPESFRRQIPAELRALADKIEADQRKAKT